MVPYSTKYWKQFHELYTEFWIFEGNPKKAEDLSRNDVTSKDCMLLLDGDDKPAGFISFLKEGKREWLYVAELYVAPRFRGVKCRGQTPGEMLVRAVLNIRRADGTQPPAYMYVVTEHKRLIDWYMRKFGFKRLQPDQYVDWVDWMFGGTRFEDAYHELIVHIVKQPRDVQPDTLVETILILPRGTWE